MNTPIALRDNITTEYLSLYKSKDQVPLICPQCNRTFSSKKCQIQSSLAPYHHRRAFYCSRTCSNASQCTTILELCCTNCSIKFQRYQYQFNNDNSINCFCSRSCAVSYNNTHKQYGTRRSKLEAYLEEQMRSTYPSLNLLCNSKDAIQSELDFYFPDLKFAIELNGIFHYEPIYGKDKLTKVQNNDQQKFLACHTAGIALCIIDSSTCTHLTQTAKDKYWNIVNNLLIQLLN